ncbi:MAG: hypothetical protein AB7U78_26220, partial [Hyphomicrobiaceae bacterium]
AIIVSLTRVYARGNLSLTDLLQSPAPTQRCNSSRPWNSSSVNANANSSHSAFTEKPRTTSHRPSRLMARVVLCGGG